MIRNHIPIGVKENKAPQKISPKGDGDNRSDNDVPSFGWLNINSSPWSYVSVDGKRLQGHTPYRKIKVKSGHHTLTFENPSLGLKTVKKVEVTPWEEINVGVSLR